MYSNSFLKSRLGYLQSISLRPAGKFGLLLCIGMFLTLAGCASKQPTEEPVIPSITAESVPFKKQPKPVVKKPVSQADYDILFSPDENGQPLTKAERKALLSEGELDKGLSPEDMKEVARQFKKLVHGDGRVTVKVNTERCKKYFAYMQQVLRQYNLPSELLWLAFVESGYNPQTLSESGALGVWQFVPETGNDYGMEQSWWLDERRDPWRSTKAAAQYLSRLYSLFQDWNLAITAYNCGEGKLMRVLDAAKTQDYFEACRRNNQIADTKDRFTTESLIYLPRILAVCKIMRNLKSLGFPPLNPDKEPPVVRLDAKPGTDLLALSKAVGLKWKEFNVHNPAYHRYINHSAKTTPVYVPRYAENEAIASLRQQEQKTEGWRLYVARRGDTLPKIAKKTGIPVAELIKLHATPVKAGTVMRLPGPIELKNLEAEEKSESVVAKNKAKINTHKATKNDKKMFAMNDKKDNTSKVTKDDGKAKVIAKNDKKDKINERKGSNKAEKKVVTASKQTKTTKPVASAQSARSAKSDQQKKNTQKSKLVQYKVKNGDSLWAIARKFNVSPIDLLKANNMNRDVKLQPGETVRVTVN